MPEAVINLLKGDRAGIETDYRDYLPVNMSAVVRPMFGAAGYLLQQPGLTQYGTGNGIDRGAIWNERLQLLFRLSGDKLITVDSAGNTTVLGTIAGNDAASFCYSFNTQGVVANGQFYLYDPGNGFREVTDTDLGNPIDCVWVDGYYFFTDGEFIYHTDLNDETVIDPLKFATSEFSPDPTLAVAKTPDNKVMVFNRYTIEYFINVASVNFAFERVATRAIKAGIVGTHAHAEMTDGHYILGGRKNEDVAVHLVRVGSVVKVSSREVDKLINQYSESLLSKVVVEARVEDDYSFIIVHLPNETLLFNSKMAQQAGLESAWTILKSDVQGNTPWRAKHGVFDVRCGQWVYGDKQGSTLGILDNTVATHYDEIAEWILYTPFLDLESASIDELDIEILPGFTATADATVAVSLTYDGITHGKEWFINYGQPSQYVNRFILRRLGNVNNWVAIKLRGATRTRMAFSRAKLQYG